MTNYIRTPITSVYDSSCAPDQSFRITFKFNGATWPHTDSVSNGNRIRSALPLRGDRSIGDKLAHYFEVAVYYHLESGRRVVDSSTIVNKLSGKDVRREVERLDEQKKDEDKESKKQRKQARKEAEGAQKGGRSRWSLTG